MCGKCEFLSLYSHRHVCNAMPDDNICINIYINMLYLLSISRGFICNLIYDFTMRLSWTNSRVLPKWKISFLVFQFLKWECKDYGVAFYLEINMHMKWIWHLLRLNMAYIFLMEMMFHEQIGEKLIIGCFLIFLIVGRIFPKNCWDIYSENSIGLALSNALYFYVVKNSKTT